MEIQSGSPAQHRRQSVAVLSTEQLCSLPPNVDSNGNHLFIHSANTRKRVYPCLGVTCHLHFWQNDWGNTVVTRGWDGHRIRVSTESLVRRRKFSRRSCRDSNSQPFDHESGALTNKLSRLLNESRSGLTIPLSRHNVGTYPETRLHATRQRIFGHSRLSWLSHCGLIQA